MKIGTELFNCLKGFGYLIELYTEDGNGPIANPDLAAFIYAKDKASQDSLMLRLPEDATNEYAKVVIYKSEGIDDKLEKLLMTIKKVAISYGSTVDIREFGKNIEPKDLAFLPQAKREQDMANMNEAFKDSHPSKEQIILAKKILKKYPEKYSPEFSAAYADIVKKAHEILARTSKVEEDVVPFENKNLAWYSGNHIELRISLDDAETASGPGDAEDAVNALRRKPYIEQQLERINPEYLKAELKECGAWDEDELADYDMNLTRFLWIACCDIHERAAQGEDLSEDVVPFKPRDLTCRECGGKGSKDRFAKSDICTGCYNKLKEDVVPFPSKKAAPTQNRNSSPDIEDVKLTAYSTLVVNAYKKVCAQLRLVHPEGTNRPLRLSSIYKFLIDQDEFYNAFKRFEKMIGHDEEYDLDSLTDDVARLLREKSGVNVINEAKVTVPEIKAGGIWNSADGKIKHKKMKKVKVEEVKVEEVKEEEMIEEDPSEEATEEDTLTEGAKYHRYGTTRSSYHVNPKAKNARVIIRHSKKVIGEGSKGERSRNVKSLYVESLNGERRLIETKSLMCARAIANHVNTGGSLFDDTSNRILALSEDIKHIRNLKKKYPVSEDVENSKLHQSFNSILEGLGDFMKCLNTSQISTLSEALNLSTPHVSFAKTFYEGKLGESYQDFTESLARGSVLYTRTRKFLPR